MTVASTTNRITYTGNGAVSTYSYTFRVFDEDHLLLTVRNTAGVETTLTITTDYTVTGVGDSGGGTIVLVNASQAWLTSGYLTSGYTLTIRRVVPLKQETDIRNQGDFLPESHEDEFDKLVMADQQQQDELDRSIKLPETISGASFDTSLPSDITDSDSAGKAIVVNATADGFELSADSYAGADALFLRNTVYIAYADSPYSITSSHRGKLISVDTSGGAVAVNLPAISGLDLTEAFAVVVRKQTSDTNAVTIAPNGSETIDKVASSITCVAQTQGYILTPDTDTSPDDWQSLGFRKISVAGSVVGTTDTQTLTNKSLSDSTTYIIDDADATKIAKFQCSGITTGTTRTFTFPDANTTLVGTDTTQTLTNKTLTAPSVSSPTVTTPVTVAESATPSTPASGYGSIYPKSDGYWYIINDAGTETRLGAGSGGINYITNSDAESDTTGWGTYANASAKNIPDGTITGTATGLTFARTVATSLRGTAHFQISQANATSLQGKGVYYAFSIDASDKAKVLNVSFDYNASTDFTASDGITAPLNDNTTSTNAGNSDVEVFVYDVTNSVLIPVSPQVITGKGSNNYKYTGTFQTSSSSTSYRLFFHVASTSAPATGWVFKFDNVVVGPQAQLYGAPISDWVTFTPTCNSTTATTPTGAWRRVGDSMQVFTKISFSGTPDNVNFTSSLPTGYTIDTTKLITTSSVSLGSAFYNHDSTFYDGIPVYNSTTTVALYWDNGTSATAVTRTSPATIDTGDFFWINYTVPISGWGTSVLMSNDTDTRVVAVRASGNAAAITATNPVIFPTADYDSHGAYSTVTGIYTVPVSGYYDVSGYLDGLTSADAVNVYVNAVNTLRVATAESNGTASFSAQVKVTAGQTIYLSSAANNINAGANSFLAIKRVSGPSAIAATETVAARYDASGSTANSSITAGATEILDFDTKSFDTHSAVTTGASWKFTAPISGKYRISGGSVLGSLADTKIVQLDVYKNGSVNTTLLRAASSAAINVSAGGSCLVSLLAGDYVDLRITNGDASDRSISTSTGGTWVSIERIGN